jgi:hypothetical protein
MIFGERRLSVEGSLCPVLHDGVLTVLTQLREWFDKSRVIPAIEATHGFEARRCREPGRAGQFFSGGVDTLAMLRRNRLMYPADHPRSIRDGLYVFGWHPFDFEGGQLSCERFAAWEQNFERLQLASGAAGRASQPDHQYSHRIQRQAVLRGSELLGDTDRARPLARKPI